MPRFSKPRTLSMALQAEGLKKYRDTISVAVKGPCHLEWCGRVLPSAAHEEYTITVDYRTDTRFVPRPRIFIVEPQLRLRNGVGCPHRHGHQEPCVYYHPGNEWRTDMLIAHTIIPWTSRWLYFYEIWMATGEWMGGGIPHDPPLSFSNAITRTLLGGRKQALVVP